MAASSLMLPIAGVFLVACVSGIMSQPPPSLPLPPPPPSPPLQSPPPPSPTLQSPPPPSPTLQSPPPPSPPILSPPPPLLSPPPPSPPLLSPPPPSFPPPTSPPPPPQPPPLPPPSSPPSSPPLPSSPPSPPLSSPSSPPLSSLTPSSPPSLPPLSPISLPPLSPSSLPIVSPISLPPLSPPSPAPAPAPTSGAVYSKPFFNSTVFVHENLLVVAGPGGDVNKLQRGSVVVVTNDIKKTSHFSSKVLGVFQGQYVQDGNETIRVTASATIFADSENPYNTTYEIVGQRTSLTSSDGFPLSVVSGIQFNVETKEYSYGLTGIAFIDTVSTQVSPQKLSLVPSPNPSDRSEVALQQNIFRLSILFCRNGRCQG